VINTPSIPPFADDVDVAVVSHNGRDTLPRLLECLMAARTPRERIVVYDVGSTDGTREWIAEAWPGVTVRRLEDNVGPDPGRNWALRAATRPYLLLLDADAYVRPDAPARMRAALDPAARVGMVTPVVVHTQRPDQLQYAAGGLHFICEAVNPFLDRPLVDRGHDPRDIGAAPAVALLIDVAVAHAIGLWDDRYFIGKEDGDFCHRIRMGGYRLVEDPAAIVEHRSKPRSNWLFVPQIRNRWHFLLKNYEVRTLVVLAPALLVHETLQLGMLIAKGHWGPWRQAVRELRPWLRTLRAERAVIQGMRRVPDRDLLEVAPLIVRADLVGGGVGQVAKRLYDTWLRVYWGLARRCLS
jgi:GT2 family glycosyltransferase